MTNREFFVAVSNGTTTDEVKEHAAEMLKKLDERNKARSSRPSKTQIANEPIKGEILNLLSSGNGMIASEIGEALNITSNKASSLCSQMVKAGVLTVEVVKVPKRGKCNKYAVAQTVPTTEETDD